MILEGDGVVRAGKRRYRGTLRVRGKEGPDVHDGSEWDIFEVRGSAVIADHAVGKHRKRRRRAPEEFTLELDAEAASSGHVVYEHEFAAISHRFIERREFSRFRAKNLSSWFFVLRAWLVVSRERLSE